MALLNISSPHTSRPGDTGGVMRQVLYALLPGIVLLTWFFGPGHLIQIGIAAITALACEALVMVLRKRPVLFYLKDYSALLTAVLLALALPPLCPWWVTVIASAFAIIFAKHLYGGMGYNPFNPAMVGFALVLISFPVAMTTSWTGPAELLNAKLTFSQSLHFIFSARDGIDAVTMATPLDVYKHQAAMQTSDEIFKQPIFGSTIAIGWEWISLAYALGGIYLLWRRIFTWHIPLSVLTALSICSVIFGWDADTHVPLSLHLFTGATMLGAFFIATDPVTASTTPLGKIIYGAGIGILIYVIRTYGAYPDAIAFAVLLMNFAAAFIDQYTQPRTYGHNKAKRGLPKGGK
ncbi:MAG: electron transport complex subunit RsxD [Oceanospirillaceae bacterium]|nr:electron transport complex subunit RsxD [Oceanospirillaceae bacterium]MCP5334103.1 electron transport complex subunit RsxD [Oceanospirillaceae bacterium]MCP5351261.1 electron transport complex subunit RsxD [Oceanospirillaceae bacterium]